MAPEDVGLVSSGRRRVPGLRREEVAELAGISLAWYTRFETAQDIRVSPRLVDRLATVLRLTEEEKLRLFSLAIDELPTYPRASPATVGTIGKEYFELVTFARRSRAASSLSELVEIVVDLLFDLEQPVEDAYFVKADLALQKFHFLSQRVSPHFEPAPDMSFDFSSVHDADEVLVKAGLCAVADVAQRRHVIFAPRAKALGAGRFISKGLHTPMLDGAIGYFQATSEPFSERDRALISLIAEIVYLAIAARH